MLFNPLKSERALARSLVRSIVVGVLIASAVLSVPAATLLNRYSFTGNADDSIGGAHGTLVNGASVSSGAVVLDGANDYVDLPNGLINSLTDITIETWLTDNNSGTWSRIFDFGNSAGGENNPTTGTEYIFCTPNSGSGTLRVGLTIGAGEQLTDWAGTRLPTGTQKHVVYTLNSATTTARLYVDGVEVGVNTGVTLNPSSLGTGVNNWIGRANWGADPFLNATMTEFRIYDGVLTLSEIQQDFAAGPDIVTTGPVTFVTQPQSQAVNEAVNVTFTTTFSGTPTVGIQWRRNGVNISGATNNSYTFAAALADHNAAYSVVLTNAYLATPYSVTSSNAILSVTADTTTPALVSAASLFPNEVRVTFSEGVADLSGTNAANYVITRVGGSLAVSAARFGSSLSEIILTTATQSNGTNYTVTINNVRDRSIAANMIAANSQASFIATPFINVNIGNPAISGSQTILTNGVNVNAAGTGISGTSDQFTFSYQNYTNNFDVRVRVAGLSLAGTWTRAALMARNGLATNSMFAASIATPGPMGCNFESRTTLGGSATFTGTFPVNYPDTWLRLRRVGNVFDGFASLDGSSWEFLGSSTLAMSNTVQIGFALTSASAGESATAQFRDFANASGTITTNATLPFEPLGPSSRRTALVMSELMYSPREVWEGTNSLEFIELWNSGLITEDLTGHKLTGEIDYAFPAGTTIAPGEFLVIAKEPSFAQTFYGVTFLGPYTGKLSNGGGTVRLRNEIGGILLEVNYDTKSPWPVAADGTGHSLVLNRPSYGENDPRAWASSDAMRGSPGAFEPYGSEPMRGVVINEFLAHTDLPQVDYIELFNTRTTSVNISGAWLSDDAGTNKYQIVNGTTIPARSALAFTQTQLGFGLSADGEAIYLVNSNQTRVLDAVKFDGQENGVAMGRHPNGAPTFSTLVTATQGTSNTPPRLAPVVINEIMYHPISGAENDEYIELYNRSGSAVNLSGWKLQGGVGFTFPTNTIIAANSYLVIAESRTNLLAKYAQLNATNCFGDYSGSLADGGERIELAMPDDLVSTNGPVVTTNIFYITVDEVAYADGGRWGKWSDGGGSSLELIDADADNRLAASWADSNESTKAAWTTINVTNVMENGQTGVVNEGNNTYGVANRFELFLQGDGESLVDNIEFLSNGGANLVVNGDFASGVSGWVSAGVLRQTFSENGVGIGSSTALHMISTGRGDTGPNKIYSLLSATAATTAPNTGTIRAQVRWLKGSPYVLLRVRGNWMEVSQRLTVPNNLGSPGLVNSRFVANAGPAITDVSHAPVLPAASQPVIVSARATDPDGVTSMQLRYRIDPSASYTTVNMTNDNGVYFGAIPGQASGTFVAFVVSAMDALTATNQFPAEAPTRECHVRWGESAIAGGIGTYRLWVTAANISSWTARERNANDPFDATFVYGNHRAIYNVETMYSGSPFHAPSYNGPLNAIACDYEINFRKDERFLGSEPFVLSAYDVADGSFFFNDDSAQVDITGNWIARKLGQQYNHRRHVHMYMNGTKRGTIYDDTQQPNSEMLDQYYSGTDAELRKIESWFEFAENGQDQGSVYTTLARVNKSTTGAIDEKRYRWNWRPRATDDPNRWSDFTNLIAAVNNTASPNFLDQVNTWMDVPNYLGPVITHHICGSWDSYAYSRGKNMFAVKPENEGWRLAMWDIEIALGAGGDGTSHSIYAMVDSVLLNLINNNPSIHRQYLRGFQEACDTSLIAGAADAALDERYSAFQQHGIPLISPQFIKSYIAGRRAYLLTVLPTAAFAVTTPAYQVITSNNVITVQGNGPLSVENILVNSNAYAVTWTSTTAWRVSVPLSAGTNILNIAATDRNGNAITNATGTVTANYSGATVAPESFVVFNEIQYQPAADGGEFVEIHNAHTNYTFDLSGWSVNGVDYTFPSGATIPPGGYRVLTKDVFSYNSIYGVTNVAYDQFDGSLDNSGETLTLFRPGAGTNLIVVDRVRYEPNTPWPAATNGNSLQLVDAAQDNSRVANWRAQASSTNIINSTSQWIYVTQTATLPGNATRIYLYFGGAGEIHLDDLMLVTGSVPGSGANLVTNGNFETSLTGTWTISADFSSSALSTSIKHAGNSSLRMTATAAGGGNNDSIQQNFAATLPSGGTYTLSYWYLQNTNGNPLIVRLASSTLGNGIWSQLDPRVPGTSTNITLGATPNAVNSGKTNLPAFPPLWLNEAQANNVTGPFDNFSQRDPWAEIINTAATNVSLTNYFLTDTYTNLTKWPFAAGNTASNGFTRIWCDNQTNQTATGHIHAGVSLASGNGSLALTRIINASTQVVDYLNYADLPANWSYGSVPDAQPFYRREMFYTTPAATNNGATAPLTVFINEWLADNLTTLTDPADGQFEDWFELYNPTTNAVDVGGYFLTDNLTNKFQFQIPNNGHYVIPPGGYLLVWADNESAQNSTNLTDLHASFALAKGGEAIGLFAADGTTIDSITFGLQTTDVTEGRFPNGAANIYTFATPTPRAANMLPNTAPTLALISNRVVTLGQTLSLTAVGSDTDVPAQTLTYNLGSAPGGMSIGSSSGVLTWTPTIAPATNNISVIVADNGTPSLTATQSFNVVTAPVPVTGNYVVNGNQFTFSWATFAGQKFQVEFKDDLNLPTWTPVGSVLNATGSPLSYTNLLDEEPKGFFRLRVLSP